MSDSRCSKVPRLAPPQLADVEDFDLVLQPLWRGTISIEGVHLTPPRTVRYRINLLLRKLLPRAGKPTMATTILASE